MAENIGGGVRAEGTASRNGPRSGNASGAAACVIMSSWSSVRRNGVVGLLSDVGRKLAASVPVVLGDEFGAGGSELAARVTGGRGRKPVEMAARWVIGDGM